MLFRASRVARIFEWNDGWRRHPLISNNTRFNVMLPGFTWGLGAFGVYYGISKAIERKSNKADAGAHDAHGHH